MKFGIRNNSKESKKLFVPLSVSAVNLSDFSIII
jgi:hypothetical protein